MFFGGDPFGGHGHPGMGGMGGGRRGPPADTQKLYDVLGVDKDDDEKTISKAYKKLAMKHHPDRGGDPTKFQEIQAASEILCDPKKRAYYDKHGEEGASEQRGERRKKGPGSKSKINVTLEQIFNGNSRRLQLTRKVIDKNSLRACAPCGGQGATIRTVRMGPMVQQMQAACDHCGGKGSSFTSSNKAEVLEVHVPKGAPNGHKIVFNEKGSEIPDGDAGDVTFIVVEKPHSEFKRKGDDLYLRRTISLSDALCGFAMEVTHLDGRTLLVKTKPGDIIKPVSYDPLGDDADSKTTWDVMEGYHCPGCDDAAEGRTDDPETCKKLCASGGQLAGKGIGSFVIHNGKATFQKCSRREAMAGRAPLRGATLYVVGDPSAQAAGRLTKACAGEGMPRLGNPFERGNLFIIFDIQFPTAPLPEAAQAALLAAVPKMHAGASSGAGSSSGEVEVATLSDVDPYASYHDHLPEEPDPDSDEEGGGGGGQSAQCAQS